MKLVHSSNVEEYKTNWVSLPDKKGNVRVWKDYDPKELKQFFGNPKNKKFLGSGVRNVCFTIHNPFKYYDSIDDVKEILNTWKAIKRSIISIEIGKKGNSLHLQGYIEFNNVTRMKTILNKLETPDVHTEESRGNVKKNYAYIIKEEPFNHGDKTIITSGDWNKRVLARENFTSSEFVDWLITNKEMPSKALADIYCKDYRSGDNNRSLERIAIKYNDRMSEIIYGKEDYNIKPLPAITFSGDSGSGKSLLTKYVIGELGYTFRHQVSKREYNGSNNKMWFTPDIAYKPVLFLSEMNYDFPKKANLLSIKDRESLLEIKGGFVENTLDIMFLNSTAMTPFFIFGVTQDATAYKEITRRLLVDDSQYFVFPNKVYCEGKPDKWIVENHPPSVYKMVGQPDRPDHMKGEIDLKDDKGLWIELVDETTIRVHYPYKEMTTKYYGEQDLIGTRVPSGVTSYNYQIYEVEKVTIASIVDKAKELLVKSK